MNSEQPHSLIGQLAKNRTANRSVLIVLPLVLVTLVMIGLSVVFKHYEGDINAAGIITSFLAGMFGYATLEFLRRGSQKI